MKRFLILISPLLIFFSQICLGCDGRDDLELRIKKEEQFFNKQYTGYIFELKNISEEAFSIEKILIKNSISKEYIKNEHQSSEKASELCMSMIGFGIGEEPSKTPLIFAPVGIISLPFAFIYDSIKTISISSNAKKYAFKKQETISLRAGKTIKFSSIKKTNSSDNLLIKIIYKINQQEKSAVFRV